MLQGHCHQKAIMKMKSEEKIYKDMGMDIEVLDAGCCGMAGYFGYEKGEQYEVSVKAGERVLLPAVRKADKRTIIIADGFSCREQIEQLTGRKGLHTAQVLQMALHENGESVKAAMDYPEKKYVDKMKLNSPVLAVKRAVVMASIIGLVAVGCLLTAKKKSKRVKNYDYVM